MRLDARDKFPSGMEEYLSLYGWHFSKAMCDWACSKMYKTDASGKRNYITPWSKEAINSEIISLKTKSEDIINSVDYHKNIINDCDKLLSELNPDFAERQKQQDEIKMLKEQISSVAESVSTLISELRKAKN